ncbi:MAG: hypothetical protein EOQ39_18625 [Mesorhizobium sp.]|uniref:hypothetical protein n=1 Tax=Mesorhizobium sp. TaxID=1871066 RepID=UPI000FE995F4|nr:hypothetical protein [Mesorhizobium sp.]RWB08815.1 MAG: hypothetical protein EOQ37_04720 [Mesorhizobium sp.]RWB13535.1 MAG: hypothetical protein EOQ39_18625 [Mesorhizobium sp.]
MEKTGYLIDNHKCLASVIERPFWVFWTRWHYRVSFYKYMHLVAYKVQSGREKTEADARFVVEHLYLVEIERCPTSSQPGSSARSSSSTAA